MIQRHYHAILLCIILCISSAQIISTYRAVSPTADEAAHIAIGMEWLQRGTYEIEPLHPPLARILAALPLYLSGMRISDEKLHERCTMDFLHSYAHNNDVEKRYVPLCLPTADWGMLYSGGRAEVTHRFALARLGLLPVFMLLLAATYALTTQLYGRNTALLATLLLALLPPIRAHAGIATTDVAMVACVMAAAASGYAYIRTQRYSMLLLFAVMAALALLSKFTALVFLPLILAALVSTRAEARKNICAFTCSRIATHAAIAAFVILFVLWAGYRFALGTPDALIADFYIRMPSWLHGIGTMRIIPFPAFFEGLMYASQKNFFGHARYIFGTLLHHDAVWYFFPVTLFMKAPLVFWGLALVALRKYKAGLPAWLAAVLVLMMLMTSNVNVGVRHALMVYPLLCVAIAVGLVQCWYNSKRYWRYVTLFLLAGYMFTVQYTHPHYLAYFNALAGDAPETILLDSDLDWGQDTYALLDALTAYQQQGKHVQVCDTPLRLAMLRDVYAVPQSALACPAQMESDVLLVGVDYLLTRGTQNELHWLDAHTAHGKIGASYYIFQK